MVGTFHSERHGAIACAAMEIDDLRSYVFVITDPQRDVVYIHRSNASNVSHRRLDQFVKVIETPCRTNCPLAVEQP